MLKIKTFEKKGGSEKVKDLTYPLMDWELFEKSQKISKITHKAVEKGTKKIVFVKRLKGMDYGSKKTKASSDSDDDEYVDPMVERSREYGNFMQELRRKANERLKTIKHPCLVEVYDHYMDENQVDDYLVFEYVWGRTTLRMLIDRSGPMSEKDVQIMGDKMLVGLVFLQEQKVIYKYFNPWNVLLDHQGNVKLSDYGVAQENYECPHENTNALYWSCESFRTGHDWATAPWGFGVMVFEMLSNRLPFTLEWLQDAFEEKEDLVVTCPEEFSEDAKSLLRSMLFVDGYKGINTTFKTRMKSFVEAQKHPFFASNSSPNQRISCFDWSKFNVLLIYHSRKYFPKQSGAFEALPMDILKKILNKSCN